MFGLTGPENKANSSWKDDWYRHTVLIDNKDGSYSTKFSVLVASSDWPYEASLRPNGKDVLCINSQHR